MNINTWLIIGLGGALGAISRYGVSLGLSGAQLGSGFPWATLVVNIVGCFLIGAVYQFGIGRTLVYWLPFIAVGFLGGFTTFSSFGLDAIQLFQAKQHTYLWLYVLSSNIIGLGAVFAGMKSIKLIWSI
jgi:fluoride exporter